MNTQTALKYYHLWNQTGIYDAVYLFGDESRTDVENALGGPKQVNAPHFIELYAALAAIDFFDRDFGPGQSAQYFMTARAQSNQLQWSDLPDGKNSDIVLSRIGQLTQFAFAYLSVYYPAFKKIADHNKDAYRASWYVDFFERRNTAIDEVLLNTIKEYCESFLLWLANIQGNCSNTVAIKLIDYSVYAERKADNSLELKLPENFSDDLNHLIQSQTEIGSSVLDKLWERMCNSRRKSRDAQGLGRFLRALYDNCGE